MRTEGSRGTREDTMRKGWLQSKPSALAALAAGILLAALAGRAGATTITAMPVDFSVAEGTALNDAVATFTDDNAAATPADFTATIDWGAGSPTTAGRIVPHPAAPAPVAHAPHAAHGA